MNETPCPCCGAARRRMQRLCTSCWNQLRVWVKDALKKQDGLSARRSEELREQIQAGRPLKEIEVTP